MKKDKLTSFFLTKNSCRVITENIADNTYRTNSNNFLQYLDKYFNYIVKEVEIEDFKRIGFRSQWIIPIEHINETEEKIYNLFFNESNINKIFSNRVMLSKPRLELKHKSNKCTFVVSTLDGDNFKKTFSEKELKFYEKSVLVDIDYFSENYVAQKIKEFYEIAIDKSIEMANKANTLIMGGE